MTSVRNAFTDRANALLRVQSLSGDLFLLHTQAAKLESVSSRGMGQERLRYQKIEELKETIRKTEDAKGNARQEYELIKVIHLNLWIKLSVQFVHCTYHSSQLNVDLLFITVVYLTALCKVVTV
jgi:hypothetical protein